MACTAPSPSLPASASEAPLSPSSKPLKHMNKQGVSVHRNRADSSLATTGTTRWEPEAALGPWGALLLVQRRPVDAVCLALLRPSSLHKRAADRDQSAPLIWLRHDLLFDDPGAELLSIMLVTQWCGRGARGEGGGGGRERRHQHIEAQFHHRRRHRREVSCGNVVPRQHGTLIDPKLGLPGGQVEGGSHEGGPRKVCCQSVRRRQGAQIALLIQRYHLLRGPLQPDAPAPPASRPVDFSSALLGTADQGLSNHRAMQAMASSQRRLRTQNSTHPN